MAGWISHLPDEERSALVEDVCRLVEQHIRAVIAVEHPGPPAPIVRPLVNEEPSR